MNDFLLNCLAGNEQTFLSSTHTKEKAMQDAEYIHDKTNVFEIICAAPPEHLQQISQSLPRTIRHDVGKGY